VNSDENALIVILLEYDRIEGMIMSSELTKVLQRGVQKALKVGKQEVARVIRVDTDKGYIDLSKKEVQP